MSTTFRPLGRDVTARLLWHGYFQAMINARVLLEGCPLVHPFPPSVQEFTALAGGVGRQARPVPWRPHDSPAATGTPEDRQAAPAAAGPGGGGPGLARDIP